MKTNIVFFEDAKDLESLTGLSYDELWDKGFDLDDMDWGFVSDENYITETMNEFGDISMEIKYDIPQFAYQILSMMESYCVGFHHVEYNNKHYYTLHHSWKEENMWFITVFEKYVKTNTAPDIGEFRPIGYYPHKEMAIEDVLENAIDMHEDMYKYAVIEFIPCGLYQPATEKIFFEWDDQSGHYLEVDSENFSDDFGNYAIG